MDISQLSSLSSKSQIIAIIHKGSLFGGEIWQTNFEGTNKLVFPIVEISHDLKTDRFILRSPVAIAINPNEILYIKLNYRNLIFRLYPGQYRVHGDKLVSAYPSEAQGLPERKGGERYVLPFHAEISLSLKRLERNVREMTYEMELRIMDVSERGFGILISSSNRDYFKSHDHFWLRAIDHKELRTPILGSVCYVAPKGYYLKRGDVRVGLSLSLPLEKETIDSLKRRSFFVLEA